MQDERIHFGRLVIICLPSLRFDGSSDDGQKMAEQRERKPVNRSEFL